MIGYIKGKVIGSDSGIVILENNGIGYEIVCSGALFAKLVTDGAGEAYTYLQVREDGLTLFGFVSVAEKNMFLKLVTVSGVGPKMGIAILSQLNLNEVAIAIATSDLKRLSAVKGLGKKAAERIVLELREKVGAAELAGSANASANEPLVSATDGEEDAVVGLMSLGYTRAESVKAVKRARENGAATMEEMIMTALKSM